MGVDYLTCTNCEDNFPDCGPHESCECGRRWCTDSCAESDGFKEGFDEEGYEVTSCNYCRGEDVEDYQLLQAAMKHLGVDRQGLIEIYKKFKEAKES
ncbi:hypothetical protein Slash_71 [Bacillus phage Slash]|uniref:Uncharacterized protein n=2 Tax=Slashvirus TaxID=1921709 RepID=U5PWI2_9CAUD|nr:hypothetical protein Staley_73 [Bacillus phage Staley]YP_008771973.1 hypothetical protein Slash_71 [Bacillus phage Slash]AGY48360.1 hypothetical protein Slash_71 [Bacillus phage Slash]AGY48756.1 hypothetical protein Staley_73 [Bacillus phage Staley]